tara:strand:- start:83 stop:463 length:381 start_codon:yes stop_codon:yes gene_type:complete
MDSKKEIAMAQYEEITIDQGADVTLQLELVDTSGNIKDLTDYSVSAKAKRTYNSDSSDTFAFSTAVLSPATGGKCALTLTNTQTDAMKAPGRYFYDVELSVVDSDGDTIIERVLEGVLDITPSVTK